MEKIRKQFYVYSTGKTALTGSAGATPSAIATIRINDTCFEVIKLTGSCSANSADVTVQITLTDKSQTIFYTAIPFNDVIGTAQLPSIISNLFLEPNTNIDITLTNANAVATNVYVTLIGNKLFKTTV